MRIAALVHMYPPMHNAGAEHMLHAILEELVRLGHDAHVVISAGDGLPYPIEPYELDGVTVSGRVEDLRRCDALITHLDRTRQAERWSIAHGVPLVQIMHNHLRPPMARVCALSVYNTDWLAERHPCQVASRAIVVHPPIWPARYATDPGDRVTLINLSEAKGAGLFYELAKAMPDLGFLGVRGAYGEQLEPPRLPNLEVIDTQADVRVVYRRTRVLLMPSSYESYGRCAMEAAVSGIPCVANGTPGLLEALGPAGTFPARLKAPLWERALRDVLEDWTARSTRARARAKTLDPAGDVARLALALEELSETPTAHSKRAGTTDRRDGGIRRDGQMGPTIITKVRLYRTDPITRIRTLAFPAGAAVPVDVYEQLTGQQAPVKAEPTEQRAADVPAKPKNPTKAELKARLDELGVEYAGNAKLDELAALVEEAEKDAAGDEDDGESE